MGVISLLEKFKGYLADKAHIEEKYIPYYLKWVSQCYRFLDQRMNQPLDKDLKDQFLKQISKHHEGSVCQLV